MHFPLFFEALYKTHEFFPECVSIFLFLFSPPSSVSTADNTLNGHKQLIRTKWEEIRRILASRGNWESEIKKTGVSSEDWRDCQVCTNSPSLSYIYLSCPSPACLYLTLNTLHRKSTFTYWLLEKHSKHVEKVPASFIQ